MDTSTFFVAYEPTGSQWPAWVQAIGSLLGIAIAISVPWLTHRSAAKLRIDERRRKGHAIAVLIRASVDEWRRRFDVDVVADPSEYDEPIPLSFAIQHVLRKRTFEVPSQILVNARDLEYLDQADELILQSMYKAHELDRVARKFELALNKRPLDLARLRKLSVAFFPAYQQQMRKLEVALVKITNRFDLSEQLKEVALEDED